MSYILQALKESEARRSARTSEEGGVSDPMPPIGSSTIPSIRRPLPLWGVLGGVLLLAGAGFILFGKAPVDRMPVDNQGGAPTGAQRDAHASSQTDHEIDMVGVKLVLNAPEEPKPSVTGIKEVVINKPTITPIKPVRRTVEPVAVAPSETKPVIEEPVAVPDPYAGLPYLRQLPVDVQRVLPDLRFSVHIYSEQQGSRLVKLGDRVIREGQRVAPDLMLEAIIPRGVVMQYRDYRFRVPAL
ncbi:MAG: general secretion pathway protein GspB [Oceanospirillales bacterium]|nr:general secretion pathway protein GspB [Oceanospirillales bacterium]